MKHKRTEMGYFATPSEAEAWLESKEKEYEQEFPTDKIQIQTKIFLVDSKEFEAHIALYILEK